LNLIRVMPAKGRKMQDNHAYPAIAATAGSESAHAVS
jgi:hypothetical protein